MRYRVPAMISTQFLEQNSFKLTMSHKTKGNTFLVTLKTDNYELSEHLLAELFSIFIFETSLLYPLIREIKNWNGEMLEEI